MKRYNINFRRYGLPLDGVAIFVLLCVFIAPPIYWVTLPVEHRPILLITGVLGLIVVYNLHSLHHITAHYVPTEFAVYNEREFGFVDLVDEENDTVRLVTGKEAIIVDAKYVREGTLKEYLMYEKEIDDK